ncbi:hypothetical protein BFP70_04295 [Thioclava sp. SK-1]|uniref:DUF6869 domain-containing protein n=1 Tax=Thioclava sp. SK-1 TaxID=1889770 RepID=UPI000826B872|nr:hypothetical protein [Thioclava sp. SK-1]OCX66460.1 hypothetical protein BFP70_04295 [Thioclava sp. SK-1]
MSTPLPPELLTKFKDEPDCPAGTVTIDDLAAHWLAAPLGDQPNWAQSCVFVIGEVPGWAWEFVTCALPRLATPIHAVILAAGPLEDLIQAHGLFMIDQIEALAQTSARFRYVLSGVEFYDTDDAAEIDMFERLAKLRGPAMKSGIPVGGPLPAADGVVSVD